MKSTSNTHREKYGLAVLPTFAIVFLLMPWVRDD